MASTPLDHPAPPTRTRFGVLGFACSLSLLTYLDRNCISRAGTDIRRDLGFTLEEMGWVFSAFTIGYTLLQMPGGWLGDKWGPRRALTWIVLVWSISTALTGSIPAFSYEAGGLVIDSLLAMLVIRCLFGLSEAGAYPNLTRVTRDWFPVHERGFGLGAIWMAARLGGAVAPFAIGRLASSFGWRMAFFILGAVGVAWVFAFRRWFTDRPEQHPSCNLAERRLIDPVGPNPAPSVAHSWPSPRLLVASPTVWAMCFASVWVNFGWYFYPTWQPEYLKQVHGFESDGIHSEILSGLPFLCGAFGCIAGGKLSDTLIGLTGSRRWGRALVGLFGFAGAGGCVLLTGWATAWWQAVALLCLAFLINDLSIPPLWAAAGELGGRYAGSVSGLMNMVGGFGAIISPILIPRVLTRLPAHFSVQERWQWIFAGLAGAWFLAAAAWLVIDATKVLEPDESAS